jgi:hypothetical protein
MPEYLDDWNNWKEIISDLQNSSDKIEDIPSLEESSNKVEEEKKPKKHKHPGTQKYINTPFQKTMRRKHSKKKRELIGLGGNKYNKGPYKHKISFKRSKSAPPIGESLSSPNLKLLKEMQYYDLSDMNMRDHMNHSLWTNNGDVLRPEISAKLTEIAKDFFASLAFDDNVEYIDIKLTGSLANYNWTSHSDIDLHIVMDFKKYFKDLEMLRDYVNAKKSIWNDRHNIAIGGHEIEIYIENTSEMHYSTGAYSILNGEWIVQPNKNKPMVDDRQVLNKLNSMQTRISEIHDIFNRGEYESCFLAADEFLRKLKKFRTSGLQHGGEFSIENLVYKAMKKIGIMDNIYKLKYDSYDEKMSVQRDKPYSSSVSKQNIYFS